MSGRAEIVRRGIELWNQSMASSDQAQARAAAEEMAATYSEDAVIDYSRTLPDFTLARGREEMLEWMRGARDAFNAITLESGEIVEEGDALVMAARLKVQGLASTALAEADFAYVFRFRDDQIVASTTFRSLAEALEAAQGPS